MDHDPGVEHEPWMTDGDGDPWQSVGDEPALRAAGVSGPGFHDHYLRRRAQVRPLPRLAAVTAAALVAGPFAIIGALFGSIGGVGFGGLLAVVLIAPAVEEVAKASGAVYLVERHPWYVSRRAVLPAITLLAGLFFAVVENIIYLEIYIDEPSTAIVVWRWIAGPLLHGGAAFISGLGVARMWGRVDRGDGPPDWSVALPWVVVAAVIHGAYNLTVTVLELVHYPF